MTKLSHLVVVSTRGGWLWLVCFVTTVSRVPVCAQLQVGTLDVPSHAAIALQVLASHRGRDLDTREYGLPSHG